MSALSDRETRRFTAEEVLRMVDAGVIGEDEPIELVDGRLFVVSPQGVPHALVVTLIADLLRETYAPDGHVREEKPVHTDAYGLPEPDVAVVPGSVRDFATRHPTAAETWLVVEVAVTSQSVDRLKAGIYAAAGAPVLWLVDVPARRIEVHTEPQPDGRYRTVHVLADGDEIELPRTDARARVADLLP